MDSHSRRRTLGLVRVFLPGGLSLVSAVVAVSATTGGGSAGPSGTIAAWGPGYPERIYLIPAGGGPVRRVITPDAASDGADLSPDGCRIAFAGFNGIWVMRRDGSRARLIFDTRRQPYFPRRPAWSPDGRKLVFESQDELVTISASGTGVRRLTTGAAQPDWSADGRRIVFVRNPSRSTGVGMISSIGTDGRGLRPIVRGAEPDVSPNGSKLAFFRPNGGIGVVPIEGGRRKLVLRNGGSPERSPDGHHLAFTRWVSCGHAACAGRVFVAPASGGKAKAYGPEIVDIGPLSWSR